MQRSRKEPTSGGYPLTILHCVVGLLLYSQSPWSFVKDLPWDRGTKALTMISDGLHVRCRKKSNLGRLLISVLSTWVSRVSLLLDG